MDFIVIDNYIWPPILFIFFLILSLKLGCFFKINFKISLALYLWHTIFCLLYFWFALNFGADSNKYYIRALYDPFVEFNFGTSFIVLLTRFFYNIFGLGYLDQFLIHGFIGYIGLLAFAGAIRQAIWNKTRAIKLLGWLLVFLPSVSFWTTGLGKDAISFFAIGLVLWAALNIDKRKILLFFAIITMFLVRPHIAVVILIAFIFSLVFDKRINIYSKIFFGIFSISGAAIILPIMLNYIGLSEASDLSDVDSYVDKRQNSNLSGGSSLDISSMSLPMQMMTYLFRPLPFEAHTLLALLASFDNLVLLILSIFGLFSFLNKNRPSVESNRIFLWVYFFICLSVLAMTTANLGIAMRQKWMFVPVFIFLLLSIIGSKSKKL